MASITERHGSWRVQWREGGRKRFGRTFADETEARQFADSKPGSGGIVPIPERIARRSTITPSGCWQWLGRINNAGYGQMGLREESGVKTKLVHRVSYEHFVGPIPDGLQIDHLCRNRACCNPAHLEPVTPRENVLRSPDAIGAQNARKTHCPQGHPYHGENLYTQPSTGYRTCRACNRASQRRRQIAKRKAAIR